MPLYLPFTLNYYVILIKLINKFLFYFSIVDVINPSLSQMGRDGRMTPSLRLKYTQQISGSGLSSIYFYEEVTSMSTEAISLQVTGLSSVPRRSDMNEYKGG